MKRQSKYIRFLPGIYADLAGQEHNSPVDSLLLAFEELVAGKSDERAPQEIEELPFVGLEKILEVFPEYFDPTKTPAEFVHWLAEWFDLDLRRGVKWEGLEDPQDVKRGENQRLPLQESRRSVNRNIIDQLAPKLHLRGTKTWLELVLKVYYQGEVSEIYVNEMTKPMGINERPSAILGKGTVIGEGRPYFFRLSMRLNGTKSIPLASGKEKKVQTPTRPTYVRDLKKDIGNIVDREKPAHCYYSFYIDVPPMRLGQYSTIGYNSLVGATTM